jgi:isochorismate synthase
MSIALRFPVVSPALEDTIASAIDRARQAGGPVFVTHAEPLSSIPDPLAFLAASASALGDGVLWWQPESDQLFAGAGAAMEMTADGPGRFGRIGEGVRQFRRSLLGHDGKRPFPIIGGFAFGDRSTGSGPWCHYPGGRLIVPRALLHVEGGQALLRTTQRIDPHDSQNSVSERFATDLDRCRTWLDVPPAWPEKPRFVGKIAIPDRGTWEASVAAAVKRIRQGAFDKVVLAREERLVAEAPFAPVAALAHLRRLDPAATLFAMQSGSSWFIGATPERLVRLQSGQVDVTCLAGSIAIGDSLAERQRLADKLLTSDKDRQEHEFVVRSTMTALSEVCETVERPPWAPRVVPARSVQHLETPLSCRLSRTGGILDLAARLHPTPAVGGFPVDESIVAMRELEEIDRGWYAGPFGWVDPDGSGEFAVAIRSALLAGQTASLFAGCGIVAASDPADEFAETQLKLQPMLSALSDQ